MGANNVSDENEERTIDLMIEQSKIIEQANSIWEKKKYEHRIVLDTKKRP